MNVKKINLEEFMVESSSEEGKFYKVNKGSSGYSCECPAFKFRYHGTGCKHIEAVKLFLEDEPIVSKMIKEIVPGNVDWVTEQERIVLVPLLPLGWEWVDDYFLIIVSDLAKLGYSKEQILSHYKTGGFREFLISNSLSKIMEYVELIGESRRLEIDKILRKLREKAKTEYGGRQNEN